MDQKDALYEAGLKVRHDMFGVTQTDEAIKGASDFTRPMQEIVTRYCFGEVWNRPLLDRKMRSLLTLAILAAIGKPNQIKVHVKGALANGVSEDEIREVFLHVMIYAGVPAAVDGFLYASEVLKETAQG